MIEMLTPQDPEGWTLYTDWPAPRGILCEFRQPNATWVGYAEELHPAKNMGQLSWRMTGIGREQWERIPLEARYQNQAGRWFETLMQASARHSPQIKCWDVGTQSPANAIGASPQDRRSAEDQRSSEVAER